MSDPTTPHPGDETPLTVADSTEDLGSQAQARATDAAAAAAASTSAPVDGHLTDPAVPQTPHESPLAVPSPEDRSSAGAAAPDTAEDHLTTETYVTGSHAVATTTDGSGSPDAESPTPPASDAALVPPSTPTVAGVTAVPAAAVADTSSTDSPDSPPASPTSGTTGPVSAEPSPLAAPDADATGAATPARTNAGPDTATDASIGGAMSAPADAPRRSGGMLVLGAPTTPSPTPAPTPQPEGPRCSCGGAFLDGWCEQCGSPQPDPRAHLEDSPADWVAGVTDVGIHHRTNQDAMALLVDGSRAGLVVCDGVSSAMRSEDASQAAADAAAAVLARSTSTGVGGASSVVPALTARLAAATDAAADAVADVTDALATSGEPVSLSAANPSCTFVAAVREGDQVVVGSVGDSRAYWFPDAGEPVRLTTDDSVAEERVALGIPRSEAESGPGSHTITRWIGVDSPDHEPRTAALVIDRPGWLVVCSDGLWNYASEPEVLAGVLADIALAAVGEPSPAAESPASSVDTTPAPTAAAEAPVNGVTPLALAQGLVTWANARGGRDNITVIAARCTPEETRG